MFIDNKKMILLNHLNKSIEKVSEELNISERTIRYRIEDLNDFFSDENIDYKVIIENRVIKGFGDLEIVKKELGEKNYTFSQSERIEMISLLLLMSSYGCKADEICDFIDISRSTFKGDMRIVREKFQEQGLKIISKANKGLIVQGSEIVIRKLLLEKFKKSFEVEDKKLRFFEKISNKKTGIIKNYIKIEDILSASEYLEQVKKDLNKKISD